MDQLLGSLDFWLMLVTIAAGVYYFVWKDRAQPAIHWLASVLQGAVRWDEPEPPAQRPLTSSAAPAATVVTSPAPRYNDRYNQVQPW
ncbi:MAG TPA: hypothetical protein VKE41_16030 [Roseiflexaceae bacterium]|nr:hypothetical protein [Roseiflexaceae bacterium]